jgi:type II secretory pathway pseudopilin PulG
MGTQKNSGFTILELILVLGVTSFLAAALFIGTGTAINGQRYRDAVLTFRNTLQTQYGEINSVRNDRSNSWSCDSDASTSPVGTSVNRGQSECVMLGRLVTVSGQDITTYSIIGLQTTEPLAGSTDLDELKNNYALNVATAMTEKNKLEWGTQIAYSSQSGGIDYNGEQTPRTLSVLYITAPTSGQIYTFTSNTVPADTPAGDFLTGLINETNRAERLICIESGGLMPASNIGVYIAPKASSSSSIESRANEILGETTQC